MVDTVTVRSASDGTKLIMYVDKPIYVCDGCTEFGVQNDVASPNPIFVRFYPLLDKGDNTKLIGDFCETMDAPGVLKVAAGGKAGCKLDDGALSGGYFAYTIENAHAETLDPVIIIEDSLMPVTPDFDFGLITIIVAFGAGVLLTLIANWLFGGKNKADTE